MLSVWRRISNNDVITNIMIALARLSRTHEVILANILQLPEQKDVMRKREIMETFKIK